MTPTTEKKPKRFEPDDRWEKAPPLPTHRPATRREVWEHYHFRYFDLKAHKPSPLCHDGCDNDVEAHELEDFCRDAWVWDYVSRFKQGGWDKHPDWKEGDPVIEEAVGQLPGILELPWQRIVNNVSGLAAIARARLEQERRAA